MDSLIFRYRFLFRLELKRIAFLLLILSVIIAIGCQENPVFIEAPLPPTDLSFDQVADRSLRLNWTDNSEGETGFLVLRRSNGNWENVGQPRRDRTRWTDQNVEEYTKYYYQVFSLNGNTISEEHASDSVHTLLAPPEHFISSLSTDPLQVRLTWREYSIRDSGFVIERKSRLDADYKHLAFILPDSTTYIDTHGLLPEMTYHYRIASAYDTSKSEFIHSTIITPHGLPLPPAMLELYPAGDGVATLVWTDKSHNEDGFDIESRKDGEEEWGLIGRVGNNITQYIDETVSPLILLEYRVRSLNRMGYSDYSDVLRRQLAYFQLNGGDETSTNRFITINSNYPFAQFMAISNDSLSMVNNPEWLDYSRNQRWALDEGYGVKKVYARFLSQGGVSSSTYVDQITPLVAEISSFVIAENADTIQSNVVDIFLDAANADSMQIGQDGQLSDAQWVPYQREFQLNLTDSTVIPDGSPNLGSHQIVKKMSSPARDTEEYTLFVRVRNSFGVPTEIVSGDINVNIFGSLNINTGAEFAYSRVVELSFEAPAAENFAVSNDSMDLITDPDWHPIRPAVDWLLKSGPARKTVYVRYKNRTEAMSDVYSASIIPATINPSVVLDGDAEFTPDRVINVSAIGDGKLDSIQISLTVDFRESIWRKYQSEVPYNLPIGSGKKTVYCRLLNDFGMISFVVNANIYTMEMNPSMLLDNGAELTADRNVRVNINANGKIAKMMISNFDDFHDADWQTFFTGSNIKLESGPGVKSVFVKIQNDFEVISETISSTISPMAIEPTIEMNNGVYFSAFRDVDLALGAIGKIDSMQLSFTGDFTDSNWEQFTTRKKIRLPLGKGVKSVYSRCINNFQIFSQVVVDSIEAMPLSPNIEINSGDNSTRSNHFSLALRCDGAIDMNWATSEELDPNAWMPYQRIRNIEVANRNGNWQIYVKFRHEFYESDLIFDEIIYDTHTDINRFSWSSEREGIIFQADEIQFELIMSQDSVGVEIDGSAEVRIGDVILGIQLDEVGQGVYSGSYNVPEGIFVHEDNVTVAFTDRAGNLAFGVADDPITIHAENHEWQFERTDNNHNILITNATISGVVLESGDEIGVFTEAGLCAGIVTISDNGFPEGLTAWGDDPSTDEVDGFVANEKMHLRFWDASQNFVYETGVVRLLRGGQNYQADGISVISLHATVEVGATPRDWLYQRTADNHNILIREALIGQEGLQAGDMIGLFTPDGLCVGIVDLQDGNFPVGLTAWADDPETEIVDGFRAEEEMMFRIWGNDQNLGISTEAYDIERGEVVFSIDGISVLRLRTNE